MIFAADLAGKTSEQPVQAGSASENLIVLRPHLQGSKIPMPEPDQATVQRVEKLRALFVQSVLKTRWNWDHACLLIATEKDVTLERYATAFFHGLEVYATRKLHFWMPQTEAISPDEMWMAQLIAQLQDENDANARYLVGLRVQRLGRRRMLFLARGIASCLN